MIITVAGEALIDLIIDPAGHADPRLGGGPFNVTRAVARLDQPVAFLGRLSGDRFGRLMRADLDRHGVLVAIQAPTDAPTTLALVDVDPAGVPRRQFNQTPGTETSTAEILTSGRQHRRLRPRPHGVHPPRQLQVVRTGLLPHRSWRWRWLSAYARERH